MIIKKYFFLQVTLIVIKLSLVRLSVPTGFQRPSPKNNYQILETRLHELEEELAGMKNASQDINNRFSSLEEDVNLLRKALENESRINDSTDNSRATKADLKEAVDRIESEINKMRRDIDEKQNQQQPSWLRNEIIEDIKGRDFAGASEKLGNLTGGLQKNINLIVDEVYDNRAGRFNITLEFGNSKNMNATTKLAIYQALNYAMESNSHNDYLNILKLLRSLSDNIIYLDENQIQAAENLKYKLFNTVYDIIVNALTSEIKTENYKAVSKISENILINYPILFKYVISDSIAQAFDEIDAKHLVNFFTNHANRSQSIFEFSAVFNELKKRTSLNQPLVVTLAFGLKKAMDSLITDNEHEEGSKLIENLPKSVKNLVFSSSICIRNKKYKEYMYAATDGFKYGDNRQVFTWIPGWKINQGEWSIEMIVDEDGKCLIKSNWHKNEYLYAVTYGEAYHPSLRPVYTAHLNTEKYNQFVWSIELIGDDMYIKNALYNEYLFAYDERTYDKNRRRVHTWMPKDDQVEGKLWTIEDCSI